MNLGFIGDILNSTPISAGIGLIGGLLGRKEERKSKKDDHDFEIARMEAEAKMQFGVSQNAIDQSDAAAWSDSQKSGGWFSGVVKFVVRPGVTGALCYMTWDILQEIQLKVGIDDIDPAELLELYKMIVLAILNLTVMVIGWWFSSRKSNTSTFKWK